jgi:hypothetical protein
MEIFLNLIIFGGMYFFWPIAVFIASRKFSNCPLENAIVNSLGTGVLFFFVGIGAVDVIGVLSNRPPARQGWPARSALIPCVIVSIRICSRAGRTYGASRRCSATRTSPRPRFIPIWTRSTSEASTRNITTSLIYVNVGHKKEWKS